MIIGGNTQQLNILQNRFTKEQLEQKKIDILKENETLQTEYNRLVQGRGLGKLIGSVAGGIPALERKITSNNQTIKQINRILAQDSDIFPVKDFSQEIINLQPSISVSGEEQVDQESQIQADEEVTPKPKPQPQPEPDPIPEPVAKPMPEADINPLFDNPNFSILIRNIGKSLAETGQVGSGLTLGAAAAAEEVAVREAQKEAAQQELLKEAIKAGAEVETITPNKATEIQTNYVTTAGDYFRTQTTEDLLNTVVGIMQRKDVTGGLSYLQEIGFRLGSAINIAGDEPSVVLVENVLTEIANSQPGDLLGQTSGRLSDRDIQLAQDLLGALRGPRKIFKTNEEVLNILSRRKASIGSEQAERLNLLKLYQDQLTSAGYGIPPIQNFSKTVTPNVSDIAGEANLGD
jgi:hypothetical protein